MNFTESQLRLQGHSECDERQSLENESLFSIANLGDGSDVAQVLCVNDGDSHSNLNRAGQHVRCSDLVIKVVESVNHNAPHSLFGEVSR